MPIFGLLGSQENSGFRGLGFQGFSLAAFHRRNPLNRTFERPWAREMMPLYFTQLAAFTELWFYRLSSAGEWNRGQKRMEEAGSMQRGVSFAPARLPAPFWV
jgi:hypothetical protein